SKRSAIRSGTSLNKSPVGVCIPFSTASIPSSILNNSRKGIQHAVTTSQAARAPSEDTSPDAISPTAPMRANSTEPMDTRFGVSFAAYIASASLAAQVVERCGITRRSVPCGRVGSEIAPHWCQVVGSCTSVGVALCLNLDIPYPCDLGAGRRCYLHMFSMALLPHGVAPKPQCFLLCRTYG